MNNKINKIFLLKIFLLVLAIIGIGFIVKGIIEKTNKQTIVGIPFLSVPDQLVDSIIAHLTLDQKLQLVIRKDSLIVNSEEISVINPALKVSDPIKPIEKKLTAKNLQVQIEQINKIKGNFIQISGNEYLNAITDTNFVIEYLHYSSNKRNLQKNDFLSLPFSSNSLRNLTDSDFMNFQNRRLNLAKNIFREENRLFGIQISFQNLKTLDSIHAKNGLLPQRFYQSLNNDIDFVLIDSLTLTNFNSFNFKGLCASRLSLTAFPDNESLIQLLTDGVDIYFIKPSEYQMYKNKILELINSGKFDVKNLNIKLSKIIKAKIWSDSNNQIIDTSGIKTETVWQQQMVEKSICLLNNPDSLIPIKRIDNKSFTVVWIGSSISSNFIQNCNLYVPTSGILLKPGENNWQKKLGKIAKKSFVIFVLDTDISISIENKQFIASLKSINKSGVVILNFKNHQNLNSISDSIACVQVQSDSENDYNFAAQAILGGISIQGQLPFKVNEQYPFGKKNTSPKTRLKYGLPGAVGVDAEKLKLVDQIALEGIGMDAYPGCQIFVAKDGEVIYNKSFGYHSYSKEEPVKPEDVYDLASVTKIAATTIATMKMISDRKMELNDQLGKFFKNTTIDYTRIKPDTVIKIDTFLTAGIENWKSFLKENDTLNINDSCFITIDTIITKLTPKLNIFKVPLVDLLMHKSGIIPATPIFRYIYYREYYLKQMKKRITELQGKAGFSFNFNNIELPATFPDNTNLSDSLKQLIKQGFKKQYQEYFSNRFVKDSSDKVRLTENLYLKNKYFDTIWRDTKQLPVFSKKVFQYSDVNMILLQLAIDSLNKVSIDEYLKKNIYNSLGLKTITYLPLKYYPQSRIIPTEMDDSWRFGYLHGYVHDPSSALMGGMVGNAGLYSNAHDLGVLFQMVLNGGQYGGIQYINPSIIQTFIKRNDETQRGLGFDMPNLKAGVGKKAGKKTYGHTGYTGTCVWVDPESQLVYVFLSNRNNPSSKNWRIITYKIRERIQDAIYSSIVRQ